MNLPSIALLVVSITSASGGQILLKWGMSKRPGFRIADLFVLVLDPRILSGFFFYGFSLLVYLKVLESVPLSLAFPIVSLGYVAVVILSGALFKEPVSSTRWLGVALICVGVVLVGLGAM